MQSSGCNSDNQNCHRPPLAYGIWHSIWQCGYYQHFGHVLIVSRVADFFKWHYWMNSRHSGTQIQACMHSADHIDFDVDSSSHFYHVTLAQHSLSSCVHLSVHHKPALYQNDWTNRAGVWHWRFLLPITHCLWVSPKIRVLTSGTLSQTLDLKNFATASWLSC